MILTSERMRYVHFIYLAVCLVNVACRLVREVDRYKTEPCYKINDHRFQYLHCNVLVVCTNTLRTAGECFVPCVLGSLCTYQ